MKVTTATEIYKDLIKKLKEFDWQSGWSREDVEELLEKGFLYKWDEGTDYVGLFWLDKNDELNAGLYRLPSYDDGNGNDTDKIISDLADIAADNSLRTKTRLEAAKLLTQFLAEQVKKEEIEAERENPPF